MDNHCSYIKTDRKHCEAYATCTGPYCFRHDPESQKAALSASRQGGRNRRVLEVYDDKVNIESPEDVKELLGTIMGSVMAGKMPHQVATGLSFVARTWIHVHEVTVVETKLKEFEKRLEEQRL